MDNNETMCSDFMQNKSDYFVYMVNFAYKRSSSLAIFPINLPYLKLKGKLHFSCL